MRLITRVSSFAALAALVVFAGADRCSADILDTIPDARNFAVLYEGNGGHNLQINSTPSPTVAGNIGLGDPGGSSPQLQVNNPGVVAGNVLFAGTINNHSNGVITGMVTGGNTNVQTDLNSLNSLSSSLGGESGTSLAINLGSTGDTQTVNASAGAADGNGNRVFTVNSSMQFNNGSTLTINGDGSDNVVFNIKFSSHFAGTILLNGLAPDQVLFNIIGGNTTTLSGGDTLQFAANNAILTGIFLDPNGTIQINSAVLNGRLFGGDSSDMQIQSGGIVNAPAPGSGGGVGGSVPEPSELISLSAMSLFGLGGVFFFRRWAKSA